MARRYSQEFREQAIRLVLQGEATMAEIARDLGVDPSTLREWKRAYGAERGEPETERMAGDTVEGELARVKRELRRVKQERDILKKAVRIFSQEEREDTGS